jgi:hypothetical protein
LWKLLAAKYHFATVFVALSEIAVDINAPLNVVLKLDRPRVLERRRLQLSKARPAAACCMNAN